MKFSAVLVLAASANAAVMGRRFTNGADIAAPRALDLAQDVRRAANASSVVEARQATNATSLLQTRQVANTTAAAPDLLQVRQTTNATTLETRQSTNATARSNLRRAAAANGTAAARSVDGKAHHLF